MTSLTLLKHAWRIVDADAAESDLWPSHLLHAAKEGLIWAIVWALQGVDNPREPLVSVQAQEWYREDLVGQAIIESGITREELFLTSKLHPRHHGYDSAMIQVLASNQLVILSQVP